MPPQTPEPPTENMPRAPTAPIEVVGPTLRLAAPGPGGGRVGTAALAAERGAEPTRIGRFVIVRRIGAGGMGVVFSAYDEELDRKVAIKLLHADRSGSQGRVRMLREAQALARLSHPNIVHVYEVGEFEGQVFMAMEFVEGMTVDEWAHQGRRPWREILAVYRQAAQGLAAAHEAGLVHRDVKPENMLITGRGRVILLDFGLARLHDDESEQPTGEAIARPRAGAEVTDSAAATVLQTLTAAGTIMGTPAYMSPEQCGGLRADARSDQFSFCVSLYEGLYGERPFVGESLEALLGAICEGTVREAPRGAKVPAWLRKVLLRGLAVRPSERWPSMQALDQALADDPSARRRRLGGGGLAAGIVAGALAIWQPWAAGAVCQGAEARLAEVWSAPQKEAVRAALRATGFAYAEASWALIERRLDAYAASWAGFYEGSCAAHHRGESSAELYDRQMACLDGRLREVQAMVGVLAAADATVLQQTPEMLLGLPALGPCGDAEALISGYAPPPDQKTADAAEGLRDQLREVRMRREAGHALAVRDQAEGIVRAARTLGYRPVLAEALSQLGQVYLALNQVREAEGALLDAFLTADAARHDAVAAGAGAWLVFLGAREGRSVEVQVRSEHVKAVIERYGQTSEADVNLHRGLATLDFVAGRFEEARRGLGHALAIAESLPEGQGERLATLILVNHGQVCEYQGDVECMSSSFERALARYSARVGADDPKLGLYQSMLARARVMQGRRAEAVALTEGSIAQARAAFGDRHYLTVSALLKASEVYLFVGDLVAAEARAEEARGLARDLFGEAHSEAVWGTLAVADILRHQGRLAESEARVEEAAQLLARGGEAATEGHPKLLYIRGEILAELGRHDEARRAFEVFLESSEVKRMVPAPDRVGAEVGLARSLGALGEGEAAAARLDEVERRISAISSDHWALVAPLRARAELALAEGAPEAALAAAERALRILERHGRAPSEAPRLLFVAARAAAASDPGRAEGLARRALAEAEAITGAPPERAAAIAAWIAARAPAG